jgi:predicted dehydrogenase
MNDTYRRGFLNTVALTTAAGTAGGCVRNNNDKAGVRSSSGPTVMGLVVPRMGVVRAGLIGVGRRGTVLTDLLCRIDGVEIKAICDTRQEALDRAMRIVAEHGKPAPRPVTGDDHAYRSMLERDEVDIVLIAAPWRWHAPIAVDVMEAGIHALVEVPVATTVEECWQLVDTAERTQKNCMMMENVCYGREELMVLNMVRQGIFGELLHGEAAYIHDLRRQMKEMTHKAGSWCTDWHTRRNGNLYPTHGLGPIAQYMGINRGDRFDYLTSVSSPAAGRKAYARREFPASHERNSLDYICGDMNTSLIKTVRGRSIMVQHDTTTPRPYTRHNMIQGTRGVFCGFPGRIALDTEDDSDSSHHWDRDMDAWYARYEHPLWQQIRAEAERAGGHGGRDFVMLWRVVYCLRNGEALDQDVYDGAAWSVVSPLSADSVADRGNSKTIPDFTRGAWETATPLRIVTARPG